MKILDYRCLEGSLDFSGDKKYPFVVTKPFHYFLSLDGEGVIRLEVGAGFLTDIASVPKPFRPLIDNGEKDGRMRRAAIFHDGIYATHWLSRKLGDKLFSEILKQERYPSIKNCACYSTVKIFGFHAYNVNDATKDEDRELISFSWLDR